MYDALAHIRELAEKIKKHVGTNDPGPDTDVPSEMAYYWIKRYFEWRGYTYYSMSQVAKPESTKLAERGWFRKWRVSSAVNNNHRPPTPKEDPLAQDPVAKVVRRGYINQTLVMTPGELLEAANGVARWSELGPAVLLNNPRELHDHLVEIAPALQTRHLFVDQRKEFFFIERFFTLPRDERKYCRPGYIRTELWEKAKTGEGLWAFTAFRSGRPKKERGVLQGVWEKVKVLEKVAEGLDDPLVHGLYKDEAAEVRKTIEMLMVAGMSSPPNDRT